MIGVDKGTIRNSPHCLLLDGMEFGVVTSFIRLAISLNVNSFQFNGIPQNVKSFVINLVCIIVAQSQVNLHV